MHRFHFAIFLAAALTAWGQVPADRVEEDSVRPGINAKFLDPDLKVDDWLKRFEVESREVFLHRHRILEACGVRPGMRVADVGAGTGLYTRMFSNAVGTNGWVFAVEINPRWLEHIQTRAVQEAQRNITTVLCPQDHVSLPPGSVDLVFVCDTYHHFEFPKATMASITQALKPGGSMVLVDFRREEGVSSDWIMGHVRAGQEVFKAEIVASGLSFVEEVKVEGVVENYVLRFQKPPPQATQP